MTTASFRRSSVIRVIALDVENAVRSQMAEALIQRIGGGHVEAHSGGINLQPIHPLTLRVMSELGLDLAGKESKSAQVYFGQAAFQFAFLLTAEGEKYSPRLFPGALAIERWPNENPLLGEDNDDEDTRIRRFRAVRDRIQAQTTDWWKRMENARMKASSPVLMSAAAH